MGGFDFPSSSIFDKGRNVISWSLCAGVGPPVPVVGVTITVLLLYMGTILSPRNRDIKRGGFGY